MPKERPKAATSRNMPPRLCIRPLPRTPVKASTSIGMPVGGTSRFSMPRGVPSQLTLQPRVCISCATASPGIT
jgi:hypothetical protein